MEKIEKEQIINSLEKEKEYVIDLGSFTVMAKNEEEATRTAEVMIDKGGWVEICHIEEC